MHCDNALANARRQIEGRFRDLSGFLLRPVESPVPTCEGPGAPSSVVYKACRTGVTCPRRGIDNWKIIREVASNETIVRKGNLRLPNRGSMSLEFLRELTQGIAASLACVRTAGRVAWTRLANWNASIHQLSHTKYPTMAKIVGGGLRFFYGASTHPAFAVLLALLLVGFVISGSITVIVSVSVFFAWLITVLWLAHSEPVKAMNIFPRVVLVLVFAFSAAFAANWYVKWCLRNFAKNQPSPVQSLDGGQIKAIFDKEIRSLPIPSIASVEHTFPKEKVVKTPVVRITGLMIQPIEIGKPVILNVQYINDRNETVSVIGHYSQKWVETAPDDMDIEGNKKIEDNLWESVAEAARNLPKLKLDIPPKVALQNSDDQNGFVMTEDSIRKLHASSAIFIAGVFEDPTGRFNPTTYCVRLDKKSHDQQVSLCQSQRFTTPH